MITTAGQEGGQELSAERSIGAPNGPFVASCRNLPDTQIRPFVAASRRTPRPARPTSGRDRVNVPGQLGVLHGYPARQRRGQ
jgi:hypothetical protein